MPRFHFHVHDGVSGPDRDGIDLPDFDTARRQALHMAGVMLQEQGLGHSPVSSLCIEIADKSGNVLLSVRTGLVYQSHPEGRISDGLS